MLPALRRSQILADARQCGAVRVRELSRRFAVSIPTIRRDLSELTERGMLARVHGGALAIQPPAPALVEQPAVSAEQLLVPRAHGLPEAAAAMVVPGMAVGISAGPTAVRLASLLRQVAGLTVVTPAPAVADALRGNGTVVVVVGGVRTPGGSHAGPVAIGTLLRLNLDIAFVEVRGFSTGAGYLTDDPLAADTNRVLLGRALRRVILAGPAADPGTPVAPLAAPEAADFLVPQRRPGAPQRSGPGGRSVG